MEFADRVDGEANRVTMHFLGFVYRIYRAEALTWCNVTVNIFLCLRVGHILTIKRLKYSEELDLDGWHLESSNSLK